jgi:DNA-binding MarR family transcriptional regulator
MKLRDPGERELLRTIALDCLCQKARKAARALTRLYDQHFAGGGIEPTQFNLLVAIALTEPVPLVRLAKHLGLDRTTLTRNVRLLQRDGLVKTAAGEDARQRRLSLTEKGARALRENTPRWRRAQKAAAAALGQAKFSQLSDVLSHLGQLDSLEGDSREQ